MEPETFVNQTEDFSGNLGHAHPPDDSAWVATHLIIQGQVQGVWYRASLQQRAQALSLVGWCRNRVDGSVEAWVQGPASRVDQLIQWAHQGPPQARVTQVISTSQAIDPQFTQQRGFEVQSTC